ncbi:MAG: serpin family protein [Oscillospiraceae bacterium]|nr:serpin family protein [Oscillospiraceae bacterium]
MKHEKLAQALNEISEKHIEEVTHSKKRRLPRWVGSVAAVLALVVAASCILPLLQESAQEDPQLSGGGTQPTSPLFHREPVTYRYLAAKAEYPKMCAYPTEEEMMNDMAPYSQWRDDQDKFHRQPEGYADSLEGYFAGLIPTLLSGQEGANAVCSPLNIYMALAMLAEITDGQSRQQILELLKADTMEALRTQATQVWQAHYNDDGLSKSILGSSLWLDDAAAYNEDTAKLLAEHYYASVFRGDLGSEAMNEDLRSWINEQTDGILRQQAEELELSPESILALATTICYQAQWQDEFQAELNTAGTFHSTAGDKDVTYMNRELSFGPYFWGEHFGAVYVTLKDGSRMWLILPDEGYAPEDILEESAAFLSQNPALYDSGYENTKNVQVNLSLPKFDVSASTELSNTLKKLGVTDVFSGSKADFSPIFPEEDGGCVSKVTHAARVKIDEEGVTAAAFTTILYAGGCPPQGEEVDFVLDRPFLFYVESPDLLPLFAGIVNQP